MPNTHEGAESNEVTTFPHLSIIGGVIHVSGEAALEKAIAAELEPAHAEITADELEKLFQGPEGTA